MLYHYRIGFPRWFKAPTGAVQLNYTKHALQAAKTDKHGDFTHLLPHFLDLSKCLVIELEVFTPKVYKLVLRTKLTDELDISFAVIPSENWAVKTVWTNHFTDKHATLNYSRYNVA